MNQHSKVFKNSSIEILNGNYLHFINIDSITPELEKLIDDKIRLITEGDTETSIESIKKRLVGYLDKKKGTTIELGAVAEFMIHLYLNEKGFKQEFLFFNLEERSIKKGFDGYFSLSENEWILESKSGSSTTKGISHLSKIKEAYADLTIKIKDEEGNNPWRNAYNHACHIDVNSSKDIIKNLKNLTDDFDSKKYQSLENLKIIPSSTIFYIDDWEEIDEQELTEELEREFKTKQFDEIHIICINKKSLQLLKDYLTK
ncbi:hypothetical protein LB467_18505 [Salegentibacter sp. JZCK2]|uniref:hypothetical protein n=1 Tax=Salegentibacter tibetensis TaxID=2873600 RepID=UPI001CCF3634|nr:hypothetical protein [Salegentibacter tibetensis]MBZ9731679.1 hypothetical protein [Salegentibacter tibetensis]